MTQSLIENIFANVVKTKVSAVKESQILSQLFERQVMLGSPYMTM